MVSSSCCIHRGRLRPRPGPEHTCSPCCHNASTVLCSRPCLLMHPPAGHGSPHTPRQIFAATNHVLMNIPLCATTFLRFMSVGTGMGWVVQRDVEFLNSHKHPTVVPASTFSITGCDQSRTVLPTVGTKGGFLVLSLFACIPSRGTSGFGFSVSPLTICSSSYVNQL